MESGTQMNEKIDGLVYSDIFFSAPSDAVGKDTIVNVFAYDSYRKEINNRQNIVWVGQIRFENNEFEFHRAYKPSFDKHALTVIQNYLKQIEQNHCCIGEYNEQTN